MEIGVQKMSGWYTKMAFVELSKLTPLTNTIKVWLEQAKNAIDESKVQESIMSVFPVIDDPVTLQSAISNAQSIVANNQGGFLSPTQTALLNLISQRVQDVSKTNKIPQQPQINNMLTQMQKNQDEITNMQTEKQTESQIEMQDQ